MRNKVRLHFLRTFQRKNQIIFLFRHYFLNFFLTFNFAKLVSSYSIKISECYTYIKLMSKPQSIKVEPWADFPKQPYTLFTDDFVHGKITFKLNAKGSKSSANIKLGINHQEPSRNLQDEVRLWWALPNERTLFTKFKHDYLKLHFDNGIHVRWGVKWNLYGSANLNKSLGGLNVRLGAHALTERLNCDNRVKASFDSAAGLTWYNRTVFTEGKFILGTLGALELTQKTLVKNNFFVGYQLDERSHFFIRAQNDGYRKENPVFSAIAPYQIFDSFKLNFVSAFKDTGKYGLEAILGTKSKPFREVLFVYQHQDKVNKWTGKIKLSSNFDVTLAVKFPSLLFKDIATTTLGIHGGNLLQKRVFKYGLQVQFNV